MTEYATNKINYVVEVYDTRQVTVGELKVSEYHIGKNKVHSFTEIPNNVIVKNVNLYIGFGIQRYRKIFLIRLRIWGMDFDYNEPFWIYDTFSEKVEKAGDINSEFTFDDALKLYNKVKDR